MELLPNLTCSATSRSVFGRQTWHPTLKANWRVVGFEPYNYWILMILRCRTADPYGDLVDPTRLVRSPFGWMAAAANARCSRSGERIWLRGFYHYKGNHQFILGYLVAACKCWPACMVSFVTAWCGRPSTSVSRSRSTIFVQCRWRVHYLSPVEPCLGICSTWICSEAGEPSWDLVECRVRSRDNSDNPFFDHVPRLVH